MQPAPPWALKPSAVLSSPESRMKSVPTSRWRDGRLQIAGRILGADDIGVVLGEAGHCLDGIRPPCGRAHCRGGSAGRPPWRSAVKCSIDPVLGRLVVIGHDDSAASAPGLLGKRVYSIASSVALEPVPAMTGTRPAATSTVISITRLCSSGVTVGLSPVVPTGTRPWLPSLICQFTILRNASSSTRPFFIGVIKAGKEPLSFTFLSPVITWQPCAG